MTNRVYKYVGDIGCKIIVPLNAKFIKVANQYEKLTFWFSVNTNEKNMVEYEYEMVPTGGVVPPFKTYLDTILFTDGRAVFHIYV